jgi:hypothetical protein
MKIKAKALLKVISHDGNDIQDKDGKVCDYCLTARYIPEDGDIEIKFRKDWGDDVFSSDDPRSYPFPCILGGGECEEFSWTDEDDFPQKIGKYLLSLWDDASEETKDKIFEMTKKYYEDTKQYDCVPPLAISSFLF